MTSDPTYGLDDIYVIRSDEGDGGWSIHLHDSKDEDGIAPTLMSGTAELDEATDRWSRPTRDDLQAVVDSLNEIGLQETIKAAY